MLAARHRDDFATVDVGSASGAYRSALHDRSGWATVPRVFVDDADVLAELADRGELAATLRGDCSRAWPGSLL